MVSYDFLLWKNSENTLSKKEKTIIRKQENDVFKHCFQEQFSKTETKQPLNNFYFVKIREEKGIKNVMELD